MKYSTEVLIVAVLVCWFIPILLWSAGESAKNWIISINDDAIRFRRPVFTAMGWVALALLYPFSLGLLTAAGLYPFDWVLVLCFFSLLSLILSVFAINAAAPRTVVLDITRGSCCETKGWSSQIKQREQMLTNEAKLLLCYTSNFHFLFLQADSACCKSRFLLSMSVGRQNTEFVVREITHKLKLPVVEGKLSQIVGLCVETHD